MPTAIAVTSLDLVLPPPDRQTPSAAVLHPASKQHTLDDSLAQLNALLEAHGYVIVLCPASLPSQEVHRLHTVRSVLESDRIALLRVDLPPLGLAALALQLRQLSLCDFSPGVLASAARLLSHYIYAGALLGSVAKLDRVPVSLTAHAKSWVPGSQFAVLATPRPQVIKLGHGGGQGGGQGGHGGYGGLGGGHSSGHGLHAAAAQGERLEGPGFATHLLIAQGHLQSDWVSNTLARSWQVQRIGQAQLPAESARWWATGKLIEFAAAIPDITMLYQLVSSVKREECHWCGLELIGDRCGFCSAPVLARESPAPPSRVLTPGKTRKAIGP